MVLSYFLWAKNFIKQKFAGTSLLIFPQSLSNQHTHTHTRNDGHGPPYKAELLMASINKNDVCMLMMSPSTFMYNV